MDQLQRQRLVIHLGPLDETAYHAGHIIIQYGLDRMAGQFTRYAAVERYPVRSGDSRQDSTNGFLVSRLEVDGL